MSHRPTVHGGRVCGTGKPKGVPPCSAASRIRVLGGLKAGFLGQFGDQGAGVCGLPGGQRNGIPRLKEGLFVQQTLDVN